MSHLAPDPPLRRLARNTGWLAVGGILSTLLTAGQTILTARALPKSTFGELALAVALGGVILQFVEFRTWEVAVKLVPSSAPGRLVEASGSMIHALLLVDAAVGTLALILTWLLAPGLARLSGAGPGLGPMIQGYAMALPGLVLANGTCLGVLRLADKFRLLTTKSVILSSVRLALVLAALQSGGGAGAVILAYALGEAADAGATLLLAGRVLRTSGLGLLPRAWSPAIAGIREARVLLGQMWLSGSIKGLIARLDIPLLARLSSPGAVANYRIALDLAGTLAKLGNPVQQAILPEMVAQQTRNDRAGQRRLAAQATLALAVPIVPALLLITLAAPSLMVLTAGPSFEAAAPVLAVVALGIGVNTMLVWSRPLLVARSRVRTGNILAAVGGLIQLGVIAGYAGEAGALAAGVGNAAMLVFVSVGAVWVALR